MANAFLSHADGDEVTPRTERALRWFVGLSLVAGGIVLLAAGIAYGKVTVAPWWVVAIAGVVAVILCLVSIAADSRPWPAMAPAGLWIISVLAAILWARFDELGHAFLSGYAALVAFATGIGFLGRRVWAWPVAFASVTGFGPIVLIVAVTIPTATIAAGFGLFLVDIVALLALARTYMQAR